MMTMTATIAKMMMMKTAQAPTCGLEPTVGMRANISMTSNRYSGSCKDNNGPGPPLRSRTDGGDLGC